MADRLLSRLLDGNRRHCAGLGADAFADCRDAQSPPVVSVCCSDSRVSQEGMWDVDHPGWLFTVGNIGNRATRHVDGERVLDGGVAYPLAHAGSELVAVIGHTGCGAVGAALAAVRDGDVPEHPGIRADVAELAPIVEDGLADPTVAPDGPTTANVHDRLVEYNVHRQVDAVREDDLTAEGGVQVYGFVYDFHRSYGDRDGAVYLVNADGDRDPEFLREAAGERSAEHVGSLLA